MSFIEGHRCVDARELPSGLPVRGATRSFPLSYLLPSAMQSGYDLRSVEAVAEGRDPVILTDRYGAILYQWPDDVVPHWLDVREVCQKLGLL